MIYQNQDACLQLLLQIFFTITIINDETENIKSGEQQLGFTCTFGV